ncbi:hypothetical protein LP416_03510 [Polaromonas sp. P2-4]|nr:hypothetical protein LP416_03510 [Polaromonas sp. P2-4]
MAYQTLKTINDPALIDEWLAGVVRAQLAVGAQQPSVLSQISVFEAA